MSPAEIKHIVMFSGGIGSWMVARKVVNEHGPENVTLLFADVKGRNASPHLGEDEDTYRFITESARKLNAHLVTLNEGRSIWQVFKEDRFLGNSRLANCSKFLKQYPARDWLKANCNPETTTVYVGISWDEIHRLGAIERAYAELGFTAKAPLCDPPYLSKEDMITECKNAGIEPPRAYSLGYPHNNCGGFCVRAGHSQFRLLLQRNRERYLFHEEKEEELREFLGKDVSILKDRTGGNAVPLTLRQFRHREENQPGLFEVDDFDFGGCGCFTQEVS